MNSKCAKFQQLKKERKKEKSTVLLALQVQVLICTGDPGSKPEWAPYFVCINDLTRKTVGGTE